MDIPKSISSRVQPHGSAEAEAGAGDEASAPGGGEVALPLASVAVDFERGLGFLPSCTTVTVVTSSRWTRETLPVARAAQAHEHSRPTHCRRVSLSRQRCLL